MATTETILNTIARGTVLVGKITTKGDIRIEGKIIGTITCDSKLVIGKNGSVEGNIDARNAYIEGEVDGTVVIRELLQLQETGRIRGDIFTSKLSVQVGANFTGNCRMGKDAAKMLDNQQEKVEDLLKSEKENHVNGNGNGAANRLSTVLNDTKEANKAG
jgi:cytoskeletal protein CcmA (bactofilin family)